MTLTFPRLRPAFARGLPALLAALLLSAGAAAQAPYPDPVVKIVNPHAVGGSVDVERLLADDTRLWARVVREATIKVE